MNCLGLAALGGVGNLLVSFYEIEKGRKELIIKSQLSYIIALNTICSHNTDTGRHKHRVMEGRKSWQQLIKTCIDWKLETVDKVSNKTPGKICMYNRCGVE